MSSKIIIDRDVFAALASDTRIEMLKELDERRKTLSEIAKNLDYNKSAIHKHLSRLVEAGLIRKEESDHKWIYYSLTRKGKSILHPEKARITLLLSSAVVFIIGAIVSAYLYLKDKAPEQLKVMAGENSSAGSRDMMMLYFIVIFAVTSVVLIAAAIFIWKKEKKFGLDGGENKQEKGPTNGE